MGENSVSGLRLCFVPPIPALDEAANLLSRAADALIAGEVDLARTLLREADMPVLHAYATAIMARKGERKVSYRQAPIEVVPPLAPSAEMPIYQRDGYRCRYCGCRVVQKSARDVMRAALSGTEDWWPSGKGGDKFKHGAFYALNACVDHLVPRKRGGTNEPDNLVTACWPCNNGKESYLLEELGIADPRIRPPIIDQWDGLDRLVTRRRAFSPKAKSTTRGGATKLKMRRAKTSAGIEVDRAEWFRQLDLIHAGRSARLVEFIDSLAALGVSWRLNKALLVRFTAAGRSLDILGVEPNGDVQVPWMIGEEKQSYKAFALALARAIPGAELYETPKMWRVRGPYGRITVDQLLGASNAIRTGLEVLRRSLVADSG